ncbi:MAG: prenyltransferase [Rhodoferax sp.]|uniref:prenyltransferase n=1 Tax=Rhodoferax sp. TaxID=50421 RepID=UPI00182B8A4A|nr:prenyltransferase [Rhodoferax sp.]NMM13417.1 prenyltransferase [Rhodoferax sp.]NMM20715.1 prenyltransferase [Rhodoferax sp.]
MSKPFLWLGPARLPFLVLTPACVLLGVACVQWTHGHVNLLEAALVLLGAMAAHVSVNAFNEYQDFHSGLDAMTQRTPFSGGSGVLPAHPELAGTTLALAVGCLAVSMGVGLYFVALRGPALMPLGIAGVTLVLLYTQWITRHPLLCLMAPGLGFGPLMILGTHVALTGEYSGTAVAASLVPFFLVNNLLLLNQFPDAEADRRVGRRHLLVTAGAAVAARWYAALTGLAFLSLPLGVLLGLLPAGALLGLLTLALALPTVRDVLTHARTVERLLPAMARNVLINLLTPVLMAIGIVMS